MTNWMQYWFPNSSSMIGMKLSLLMDVNVVVVSMILLFVLGMMCILILGKTGFSSSKDNPLVELVWTGVPLLLLLLLGVPSLAMLSEMESSDMSPSLTLQVSGNQWYWDYYYPDFMTSMSSMMFKLSEQGQMSNFETNPIFLPLDTLIRLVMSSNDVLHCWALPSMGAKMDVMPGVLSQIFISPSSCGLYSGGCMEFCGVNHSMMPIMVEIMPSNSFLSLQKS